MDKETQFLCGLLELQYNATDIPAITKLSSSVAWAQGWPADNRAFWNAEAFMWSKKIDKETRQLIEKELAFLQKRRDHKNLDLGCGAYSYLPSVGFDFSEKMLQFNERCTKKVIGSLEEKLPFATASFDSVTAVFVFNYILNYQQLFCEINRILQEGGKFVMILSSTSINEWQKQKEVNSFTAQHWSLLLGYAGFKVSLTEKENLLFFQCQQKAYVFSCWPECSSRCGLRSRKEQGRKIISS